MRLYINIPPPQETHSHSVHVPIVIVPSLLYDRSFPNIFVKYRRGNEPVNNEPFPSLTTRLLLRSRDSYHSTFRGNLHGRVSSPPSHTHPRVSPTRFESLNHRRRAADRSGTVPCFGCTVSVLWVGMVFRRVRLEDPFERDRFLTRRKVCYS